MAFLTQLETSTLTNQNASTALLVHTFTNTTRERIVRVGVYLKDLAGNGDYSVYATKQLAGTGTAYPSVLTTQAVPSGVTAHWFTSEWLDVGATDVLKIYVVGLAGDTTAVDIITQVKEMYVATDASGRVDVSLIEGTDATDQIRDAIVSDATRFAGSDVSSIKTKTDSLPFGVDFAAYFDAVPTATENAAATLNATASSYNTSGSIGAKINSAASASGDGDISHTITIRDASSNPVDGAHVWVTTTLGGTPVASGYTNSAGQVTFMLDAGTYYQYVQAAGHNFSNPTQVTVS